MESINRITLELYRLSRSCPMCTPNLLQILENQKKEWNQIGTYTRTHKCQFMSIGTWNLIVNPFFSPFSGRALKTVQLVQCTPRTNSTKKCCLGKMFHFSFCIWYSISILQVSAQIDKMNSIEWWSRKKPHVQRLIYITKIVGQTIERITAKRGESQAIDGLKNRMER